MAWCPPESTYSQDPQNGNHEPLLSGSSHLHSTEFHSVTEDYTDPWSFLYSDAESQPSYDPMAFSFQRPRRPPSLTTFEHTTPKPRRVKERCFHACPWREKEKAQGAKEFSCRGCRVQTLGEVRRHAERAHHVSFIRLCPTCNRHVLDKKAFEAEHGNDGRRYENPRKQARGIAATRAQWWELYHTIDVCVPTQVAESDVVISNSLDTATVIPSSRDDPGTLQSYTTHEQAHNPCDDNFDGIFNPLPNLPTESGSNSNPVFSVDKQLIEATSACELGLDTPLESTPIRPQHEITLRSNEFVTFPALQDPLMISKTVSHAPLPVRGPGKANYPNERQVETANTSVDNTENSLKSLPGPESVTKTLSDTAPASCHICGTSFRGEYAAGNLSRHKRLKHGNLEQGYPCLVAGCRKTYRRQDARLKHYRTRHPELEVEDPRTRK